MTNATYQEDAPPRRSSALFIVVLVLLLALLGFLLFLFARTIGAGDKSAAQVVVPDVTGKTQPEAVTILETDGFTVKTETKENDTAAEGTVFDMNPDAGTKLAKGSEVTVVVSSTAALIPVPNLVGQKDVDADAQLRALGLVADFDHKDDEDVPSGTVLEQDPKDGTQLPKGSAVRLTISNGPGTGQVPDEKGKSPEDAAFDLGKAGYEFTLAEESSDSMESGKVTRTDPPAGTDLDKGQSVTVYVSNGSGQSDVPNVVGMTEADAVAALQSAGFQVKKIEQQVSNPVNDGKVLQQDPAGGRADKGATVTITVGRVVSQTTTTTEEPTTTSTTTTTTP